MNVVNIVTTQTLFVLPYPIATQSPTQSISSDWPCHHPQDLHAPILQHVHDRSSIAGDFLGDFVIPTPDAMFALELKIPPPVVALVVGVLMWLASSLAHFSEFAIPGRTPFAAGLALAGLTVSALGFISFRRARTTVNPTKPSETTSLVVAGVYRFSRNSMYLGLLLLLLGWATFLSNVLAFAFIPVFVLYINRFQIAPEERALALKFGPEYGAYKARVRRWL